ncbi:hypothetical protein J4E85_008242 [Alternaria conjuncta]|uniref:uncharacterized protein n=2 Tax=Alternaria sect. Infectoriae TaxID=2499258 RepID=UPI0020C44C54|nr:uncharacterized protein J4E84_002418 [Alternaria hordeiaustralica]XP_051323933.1 uncharacterized protein J4E85_008242 [Alternaria conjuncta]KAI4693842.1 hypothetical protein J4E84_002418 [Alternaria hordeiaustralica]KAI4708145.1 hypothetical protein J4E89_007265 [Alternaria sp. Ai002NY15]KAI4924082.1 hypothetical protein J4E85_008242 [Alternaria conjuncta]
MESWADHFPQLEVRSHFNLTLNTSAVRQVPWTQSNTTRTLIASLQLQQVQTLRTTHLTLGAFSLALTLLTVHRIVSDARRAAALQVLPRKKRFNALHNVHPAETFPLALACGAVLQQIIFVSVQGTTLHSVFSRSCRGLAMVTFPAIFLIGFITLVFGIEVAVRAYKQDRFAPRGKWNTIICIAVVSFMLLLSWMPTVAWPSPNTCFGGLIWFPMRYDLLMLIFLSILVFLLLMVAAMISIQLMRTPDLDHNERISASRMTYFLIVTALIYTLVIPVEVQSLRREFMEALAASRVAEISLFSSGMVITFFHLFLRTNATRMVIRPIEELKAPAKQQRPKIRFFGPSDLEMQISGPMALQTTQRLHSQQGLIDVGPEKNRGDFDPQYFERPERALTPASTKPGSPIDPTKWPLPPALDNETTKHERTRSQSYSLFPTRAEEVPRLPPTVYDPKATSDGSSVSKLALRRFTRRGSVTNVGDAWDFLSKPKLPFAERHQRMQSTDSSATVQIGLRFSVAPATLAAAKCTRVERETPPLKRGATDSSEASLALPIQKPSTTSTSPSQEMLSSSVFSPPPPRGESPTRPRANSPARTPPFPITPAGQSSAYLQAQREKVLPSPPPKSPASPQPSATPAKPAVPEPACISGLRMNPVTPVTAVGSPTTSSQPGTPASVNNLTRTNSGHAAPSPTARIPLGAGTMQRTPRNGWI